MTEPSKITYPPTPELDKLCKLDLGRRDAVQEFLDWLLDKQHLQLQVWREDLKDERQCPGVPAYGCTDGKRDTPRGSRLAGTDCSRCRGTGWIEVEVEPRFVPDHRDRERLMADYFGIDLDKIDTEKRAILDFLRQSNGAARSDAVATQGA
jgi:hypothetical protein